MTLGQILYYIFLIPVLLAKGIYYFFHFVDFALEAAADTLDDLMEHIKEF